MTSTQTAAPQQETRAARASVASWIRATVPVACLLSCLGAVTAYATHPLDNFDTWFHLRLGAEFWGHWSLQHPGELSRFASSPWVPTEWSTEMAAAKLDQWFGLPGVAWMFGVLYIAFVVVVYVACRREGGVLPATVTTILAVAGSVPVLSARPQIVTMILVPVTVAAWFQTRRDGKLRWWLAPMTWVWATAHGLWSVGVLIGGVACVGLFLDGKIKGRSAIKAFCVPVLSGAAALVTPVGPALVMSQFTVAGRTSMISEWGPTAFRGLAPLVVAGMIACLVVLWARAGNVSWTHVALLLAATAMAIYYARLAPVGGVIVAPMLAGALHAAMPRDAIRAAPWERVLIGSGALLSVLALGLAVPHTSQRPAGVPTGLAPRLAGLPDGTVVLNEDVVGGWLEWRFPDLNPVIDGMFDAYPVPYMKASIAAHSLDPGWQRFVQKSHASVALLPKRSRLANALHTDLGWRRVATDRGWAYLVPPAS